MTNTYSDFLTPDFSEIKNSIRDIDDSYNHEWDIIAELCQNSVDAIKASDVVEGFIDIEIDSKDRSIRVKDNGIGISPHDLPNLLKPFSTNKRNENSTIGEKGVGLTFVMFSGEYFEILSGNSEGALKGSVKKASSWKNSESLSSLELKTVDVQEPVYGTEVYVSNIKNTNLFELNFNQIKYVLRTKTALGSTLPLWGDERNILIKIKYKDINGKVHKEDEMPFQYLLPYEKLPQTAKIDYEEYIDYASVAQRTDSDKRSKLRDKVVFRKGTITHSNAREINYVACFMPTRNTWNKLSVNLGICNDDKLEDENWKEEFGYTLIQSGIMSSVKGMPTGIAVDHPSTGLAGYWSNMFILFEDSQLKFDIGRKSIHGRQATLLRSFAHTIFNDFINNIVKYVSGEAEISPEWDKEEIFAEIEQLPDLRYPFVNFKKTPKDQEASVAALFFECIGNGTIEGIEPLISGYKNKYDLFVKWGNKKKIIEFKSKLKNIVKDFNDAVKMFNEIDCIVCWDVSENDEQELRRQLAVDVNEIDYNPLSRTSSQIFPNATHKLTLSGFTAPIYVIDLKKILDSKRANS